MRKWHNDFYVHSFLRSGRNHVSQSGTTQKGKMIGVGTAQQLRFQAEHQHGALEGVFLKLTSPPGEESDQH
jgi:hypothetical protein